MTTTKKSGPTPTVMSPQEIAKLTAYDREAAARRTIELLCPSKVTEVPRNGRLELWVKQ